MAARSFPTQALPRLLSYDIDDAFSFHKVNVKFTVHNSLVYYCLEFPLKNIINYSLSYCIRINRGFLNRLNILPITT